MSFSTQIQRILQITKNLFDPVIKALAEMREVQEKAMSVGSSGSFCCALDKCLLLPPQPDLSGATETSLSLQAPAPFAHSSLVSHLPGCLCRTEKSGGTCWALSTVHCAWDKGKVVCIAGTSAKVCGTGPIQLPHRLHPCLLWQQRGLRASRENPASR